MPLVSSLLKIVDDTEEGRLRAVALPVSGLERLQKAVGSKVRQQLVEDHPLEDFGQEREIGDGTVVLEVFGVKVGLFEEGFHHSMFECRWYNTVRKGVVYDVCDCRCDFIEACVQTSGRNRVEFTRLLRHGENDFANVLACDRFKRIKLSVTL